MSTTAVGRGSVHWLIPALVLCIAIPAALTLQGCKKAEQPPPAPSPAKRAPVNYQITYKLGQGANQVCPNPVQLTSVHKGDTVIFYNRSDATITIKPNPEDAFAASTEPITLGPGQRERRVVSLDPAGHENGIFVNLPVVFSDGHTTEGCYSEGHGPGMQVNS